MLDILPMQNKPVGMATLAFVIWFSCLWVVTLLFMSCLNLRLQKICRGIILFKKRSLETCFHFCILTKVVYMIFLIQNSSLSLPTTCIFVLFLHANGMHWISPIILECMNTNDSGPRPATRRPIIRRFFRFLFVRQIAARGGRPGHDGARSAGSGGQSDRHYYTDDSPRRSATLITTLSLFSTPAVGYCGRRN